LASTVREDLVQSGHRLEIFATLARVQHSSHRFRLHARQKFSPELIVKTSALCSTDFWHLSHSPDVIIEPEGKAVPKLKVKRQV